MHTVRVAAQYGHDYNLKIVSIPFINKFYVLLSSIPCMLLLIIRYKIRSEQKIEEEEYTSL